MIDRKWIGYELPTSTLPIETTRLRFFAKATGATDMIYSDSIAANKAGYDDILAPPTFLFAAELDSGVNDALLEMLGIPLAKLLHGEQSFTYHLPVCAGDTVKVTSRIDDIYDKKNGALEFVVKGSLATNQDDELVAEMRTVLVCRN